MSFQKRVKFKTLGCRLNQYETQALREQFLNAGFRETETDREADLFVLNSCTVTQESDRQNRYFIRRFHRQNPNAKIVVTGCYVEKNEPEIKSIPGVVLTVPNTQKFKLVELLEMREKINPSCSRRMYAPLKISQFEGRSRAPLKIQDGCNHACSFCKVVLVRGPARSRPLEEVIEEAKRLISHGLKEIILSGIQLGAYGFDWKKPNMLCGLIGELSKISGLRRIRLSSIEPTDVTDELIDMMAVNDKLCPHLHIPLQSGDDTVLQRMNRRYNRDFFLNLIKKIRAQVSDFMLTTDVMIGFPGEGELEFERTIDVLKETRPCKLHIFPYSPREGTRAYQFRQTVDGVEMIRRRNILLELEETLRKSHQYLIGEMVNDKKRGAS